MSLWPVRVTRQTAVPLARPPSRFSEAFTSLLPASDRVSPEPTSDPSAPACEVIALARAGKVTVIVPLR